MDSPHGIHYSAHHHPSDCPTSSNRLRLMAAASDRSINRNGLNGARVGPSHCLLPWCKLRTTTRTDTLRSAASCSDSDPTTPDLRHQGSRMHRATAPPPYGLPLILQTYPGTSRCLRPMLPPRTERRAVASDSCFRHALSVGLSHPKHLSTHHIRLSRSCARSPPELSHTKPGVARHVCWILPNMSVRSSVAHPSSTDQPMVVKQTVYAKSIPHHHGGLFK